MDTARSVSGEHSREDGGEASPEGGRWLTYSELAQVRGIGRESAVKLAQRERWRRQRGNDGTARVLVPPEYLKPAKAPSGEPSPEHSPEGAWLEAMAALQEAHAGETAALRDRVGAAEQHAERAEQATAEERARAAKAEEVVAGERARVDVLQSRLESAQAELQRAREHAEALRQVEAERKARGRAASWRAWRGE